MTPPRTGFRLEALEFLAELESSLLALEQQPGDGPLLRLLSTVHAMRAASEAAGFPRLGRFAAAMEAGSERVRDRGRAGLPDLIERGLDGCAVMRLILEDLSGTSPVPGEEDALGGLEQLGLPPPETAAHAPAPAPFEITYRPGRTGFRDGADPAARLDRLRTLGQARLTVHDEDVPPPASLDPDYCYLWWEILLVTDRPRADVEEVFAGLDPGCREIRQGPDRAAAASLLRSIPADAFEMFVAECEDHLDAIEHNALALETNAGSRANLDALFRAVHSIKGNTGVLRGHLEAIALPPAHPIELLLRLAHGLESLLDPWREPGAGPIPADLVQTALDTRDAVRDLLGRLAEADAEGLVPASLLERLGAGAPPASASPPPTHQDVFADVSAQCAEMIDGCLQGFAAGGEPVPLIDMYLRGLETWAAAARYQHREALGRLLAGQQRRLVAARAEARLSDAVREALRREFEAARSLAFAGREELQASPGRAGPPAPAPAAPATTRIDQEKLDQLMRTVGELLVARSAFPLLVQKLSRESASAGALTDLKAAGSSISRIADELQSSVMAIRMLPLKTVFQRFPRLVRDLARTLGKDIRIVVEGEAIEMDKTILEQLGDPLVHVVRNAVDHGIEPPDVRLAAGKDPAGCITLRAFHDSGGVAIEVADDGRGLDAGSLRKSAVERGLLTPDAAAALGDEAAFQLVFLAGVSTAGAVSTVSGRGVGMDVVRTSVHALQGTIAIRSVPGRGTTFLIRLPASLMVSKGVLLEAGGQEFILPLPVIRDMVKLPATSVHHGPGGSLASIRGRTYPIYSLARATGAAPAASPELAVVLIEAGGVRYGLIVDRFSTQVEVMVKPLAGALGQCAEFQGSAIMGDGRVVLVLDAFACLKLVSQSSGHGAGPPGPPAGGGRGQATQEEGACTT